MSLFTGIMAESLGIGGGIILNPLFISYRLLPEVSTATNNLFILLSSFSSFFQYYIARVIDYRKGLLSS